MSVAINATRLTPESHGRTGVSGDRCRQRARARFSDPAQTCDLHRTAGATEELLSNHVLCVVELMRPKQGAAGAPQFGRHSLLALPNAVRELLAAKLLGAALERETSSSVAPVQPGARSLRRGPSDVRVSPKFPGRAWRSPHDSWSRRCLKFQWLEQFWSGSSP